MNRIVGFTAALATVLALTLAGCGGTNTAAPSTSTVTKTVYASTPTMTPTPTTTSNASFNAAMRDWANRSSVHFKEGGETLIAAGNCSPTNAQCMRDACTSAHKSITIDLKADMPSPDPKLTDAVNSMIDDFDKGMHICMDLPDYPTMAQVEQFKSYMDQSEAHLATAKSIMEQDLAAL